MALIGSNQKALKQLAKKENADVSRILRNLRKLQNKNFRWKLEEGKGHTVKLYSVKLVPNGKSSSKAKPASKAKAKKKVAKQ